MPPRVNEIRTRVRYAETDQMGIAHHANHLVWFEMGRTALCSETGISYREIEARGYFLVVTEIACRYRLPYRYDDEVVIRTMVGEIGSRSIRFDYELMDGSATARHAAGRSHHLWVERATMRPVRAPIELAEPFSRYLS
jgi:acyl-CoA thioester hydrolase